MLFFWNLNLKSRDLLDRLCVRYGSSCSQTYIPVVLRAVFSDFLLLQYKRPSCRVWTARSSLKLLFIFLNWLTAIVEFLLGIAQFDLGVLNIWRLVFSWCLWLGHTIGIGLFVRHRYFLVFWVKKALRLFCFFVVRASNLNRLCFIWLGNSRLHSVVKVIYLYFVFMSIKLTPSVIFILLSLLVCQTTHTLCCLLIIAWPKLAWLFVKGILFKLLRIR